jgi:pSer/pThr/pTyr-binding forkhead associated (FHA) protein
MDLNKKIEEQNIIIENLNKDINGMITENLMWDVFSFIRNPYLFVGKKVAQKIASDLGDEIEKKEEEIKKAEVEENIIDLQKEIDELKELLTQVKKKKQETLEFKKIWIEFKEEVSLEIEQMKSPEYNRNLKGTMYFSVVDVNHTGRYITLKTKSFPQHSETVIIKLTFETLEIYQDQKGDANLIYSKYGDPNVRPVKGEEVECFYKIIDKK